MTKSEKSSPVENENLLFELIREHQEKQAARAEKVFDLLARRPALPTYDGLSSEEGRQNSIRWEIEEEIWSRSLKNLIAKNLDQHSIWEFVRIAASEDFNAAIAYGQRIQAEMAAEKQKAKRKAAAEAGHSKPGRSRDKRDQIRAIWESGKYRTKIECIKAEHERLAMSFSTADKALRSSKKSDPV